MACRRARPRRFATRASIRKRYAGYLLKSTARRLDDKLNAINMSVLRVYLGEVMDAGYQTLALINACYSGAFLSRRAFGDSTGPRPAGGIYYPKNGGAHAITAGGSNQLSWHDPKLGKGSVFFEKLLAGLGGQADVYPIYPDGHRGDGLITVDEIATYLREEVGLATNQEQIPIPADLALNRSLGGFFFLSRQKMIANGVVPEWSPKRATPFGINAEETLIIAKKYDADGQWGRALPLFRKAAEAANGEAAFHLGFMYKNGRGVPKDDAQAVSWFRRSANAGYAAGMYSLGLMYNHGRGVPKDDAQADSWYRKAIDRGYKIPGLR
jgi:Sel1 repeat